MKIWISEDESIVVRALASLLAGHELITSADVFALLESRDPHPADLLLLDLRNERDPQGHGTIAALPELKRRFPSMDIVVQSGLSDLESIRACVRNGASRFVSKEHLVDEIPAIVARVEESLRVRDRIEHLIIGQSEAVQRLRRDLIALRGERSLDVLVEGETGSGKELCAQALALDGPLVSVNVSAIPPDLFEAEFFGVDKGAYTGAQQSREGYFEAARDGVLFLDEIQSLSANHQAKLLRVVETRSFTRVGSTLDRPFRGRIVSASNASLRELARDGRFREDLYFRLSPMTVRVPPLRLRTSDVPLLCAKFLSEMGSRTTLTPAGLDVLMKDYDWPGNVRELRGLIRSLAMRSPIPILDAPELRAAIAADEERDISAPKEAASFQVNWSRTLDDNLLALERHILSETIQQHGARGAHERLGLSRSRYYEKLKQHGLKTRPSNDPN